MHRILIEKIYYELSSDYMQWINDKEKLIKNGYKLNEKSTIYAVAEKEYKLPFDSELLSEDV